MSSHRVVKARGLLLAFVAFLLTAAYVRGALERAGEADRWRAEQRPAAASGACPGPVAGDGPKLVIAIVDSLRYETAFDPEAMPWLSQFGTESLHGRMTPCLSQLSLVCMRTMFEGVEPLLVTGLHNFSGMDVQAPSILQGLARRGVRIAAVADRAFVRLYASSLAVSDAFDDHPELDDRDALTESRTLQWLDDPSIDAIVSLTIDTDAMAHREGIHSEAYRAKFRRTDAFLREIAERLGPTDSLLILGDHGHDDHGYHSTGIEAPTAFFARGPAFEPGIRRQLTMSDTAVLLEAATCEPAPVGSSIPNADGLRLDPDRRQALLARRQNSATMAADEPPWYKLPFVAAAIGIGLCLPFVPALGMPPWRAWGAPISLLGASIAALFTGSLALLWLWIAGGLLVAAVRPRQFLTWPQWGPVALATFQVVMGATAHAWLVTLQNQVNPRWEIGFWLACIVIIVALGRLFGRLSGESTAYATGLAAWGWMFFGLFIGPYYYSTARNLLFGVTWLLAVHVAERWRDPQVRRWSLGTLVPLIPLYFPVLKEWQPRFVSFDFAASWPAWAAAPLCAALLLAIATLCGPLPRWRRTTLAMIVFIAVEAALGASAPTILAGMCLLVSYRACVGLIDLEAPGRRIEWLTPIVQVSYAFMMFVVTLGTLRFANVDFAVILPYIPSRYGEGVAALIAAPVTIVRYCLPVALLLQLGRGVRLHTVQLLVLKGAFVLAFVAAMELSGRPSLTLFVRLGNQEFLLLLFLLATVVASFAFAPHGRRSPP